MGEFSFLYDLPASLLYKNIVGQGMVTVHAMGHILNIYCQDGESKHIAPVIHNSLLCE